MIDGKKSNKIIFNYAKKKDGPWNYWFKINDDDDNETKVLNIQNIFKFTNTTNDRSIYLVYGDCYKIIKAIFYNSYSDNKDYHNFLDRFNSEEVLNKKWFPFSRKFVLESIVVMHQHVSQPESKPYKTNYLSDMKPYFDAIAQPNQYSSTPIPCGPVLQCFDHSLINCNTCFDHHQTIQWHCNTNTTYHAGDSTFFIWDAKNGWLPGIWERNIDVKKYDEYTQ